MTVANAAVTKIDAKRQQLEEMAAHCFANTAGLGMTWKQFIAALLELGGSDATAERRLTELVKAGIVKKSGTKYWLK